MVNHNSPKFYSDAEKLSIALRIASFCSSTAFSAAISIAFLNPMFFSLIIVIFQNKESFVLCVFMLMKR